MNPTLKYSLLGLAALCAGTAAAQDEQRVNALRHTLQKRPKTGKLDSTRFADHTFFSIGAGAELMLYETDPLARQRWGVTGNMAFGKWFDAVSGARLGLEGGVLGSIKSDDQENRGRSMHAGLTADYLVNLAALGWGYDPGRRFELIWFAGAGGHYSMLRDNSAFTWSVRTGAQARLRLNALTDIYLEPRVSFYGDAIDHNTNWRKYNLAPALTAGITYHMVPLSERSALPKFDDSGFFENTFISLGAGTRILIANRMARDNWWDAAGANLSIGVGKWFTPVSGVRLTYGAGYVPWITEAGHDKRLKVSSLQADYMLNANAAFGGYADPQWFQLYLIAGLNAGFPERIDGLDTAFGAGVGVQAGLRVNPTTLLFVEPRLNAYNGKFAGGFTRKGLDLEGQLMVGMTYTRMAKDLRSDSRFEAFRWGDHLFVTFGAGVQTMAKNSFRNMSLRQAIQPFAAASVGKWITPFSGLRLRAEGGAMGELNEKNQYERPKMVGFGLDYLFNLTNAMTGYDPASRFDLTMGIGPSVMFRTGNRHEVKYGAEASLQTTWYVHPQLGIYLEPRMGLYQHGLTQGSSVMANVDLHASIHAGLNWRFKDYDPTANRSAFEADGYGGAFFSIAGGAATLTNTAVKTWRPGAVAMLAMGKAYTPVSAWRLSLHGNMLPHLNSGKNKKWLSYAGAEADYMFNIATLAAGYDADRPVGLQAFFGVSAGAAYGNASLDFVPGAHAGLQGSVNVSPSMSLYLEPRVSVYGKHYDNYVDYRTFDLTLGAMAGVTYHFARKEQSAKKEKPAHALTQFAQVDFGGGIFAHTFYNRPWNDRFSINGSAAYGRLLNAISGYRAGIYYSTMNRDTQWKQLDAKRFDFTVIGVHADYLLNLSNLISGTRQDRLFELTGIIGAGLDHGKHKEESNWAPSATLGVQGLWNIGSRYGIYLEGRGTVYGDKIDGIPANTEFDAAMSLNLGTVYRF